MLGLDCVLVIVFDMILEGIYFCIDMDYFVNILDFDGVLIGNIVIGEYVGEILMVLVSLVVGGFFIMGRIEVVDNINLEFECFEVIIFVMVE